MNDLIERYIYDVTKRLEESKRKDIEDELRGNILDMLGDDISEANTIKVLKQLGRPDVLALEYKEKKRYVISPRLYDDYIKVLKIVLIVFVSISIVSAVVSGILEQTGIKILSTILTEITGDLFGSIFFAFAIVTVIFWSLDYNQKTDEFDPTKLAKVPENKDLKSERTDAIVEVILTVVFGGFFLWFILANYSDINIILDDNINFIYNGHILKTTESLWIALICGVGMLIGLAGSIYRIVYKRFNIKSGLVFSILEVASLIAFTVYLLSVSPFEPAFVNAISVASEKSVDTLNLYADRFIRGGLAIAWFVTLIELITRWYKLTKKR